MEIFRLFGSVFLQGGDDAEKQIDGIDKKAEGLGSKLGGMIGTAAKWGAGLAAGASVAVGGLLVLTSKTAAAADQIDKMSIRTGISRQRLQELQFISGQVGVSFESIQGAVSKLTMSMSGAEEGSEKMQAAFSRLGVATTNVDGSMRSAESVFNETILSLARMENETERNALAMQIFGRGATELIPLLNAGEEGIQALTQKAHELGLVMNDEAIAANVEFADTMDQVKRASGAVFAQIATSLLPILMTFLNFVLENMPAVQAVFEVVFGVVGALVEGFVGLLQLLIGWLKQWMEDNEQTVDTIRTAFVAFFEAIRELISVFVEWANAFWERHGETITTIFKIAWDLIGGIFKATFDLILGLLDIFIGVFTGDWSRMWEGVKKTVLSVWDAITSGIKAAINVVITAVNAMIRAMNRISFSIPKWVPVLGGKEWGFNLKEIPMLAKGGDIQRDGMAIVGEEGPELLNLPRGARVTPLGNAGGNITVVVELDGQVLARALGQPFADEIRVRTGLRM